MDSETKEMFELMFNKLDKMDSQLSSLETRQNEIFQVVKATEHANQVHRAELDNVKVRTNYLEGTINDIGDVINARKLIR